TGIRAFYVDTAFQLAHRTAPLIWTTLLAVLANIGLDYFLIPLFGQLGAAIGSLNAVAISLIAAAFVSRSVYRLPLPVDETMEGMLNSVTMVVMLCEVRRLDVAAGLEWQLPLGLVVYDPCIFIRNVLGVR